MFNVVSNLLYLVKLWRAFVCSLDTYTVSQKVPAFKLSVTLSNLNRFSKILHHWKVYEICYKRISVQAYTTSPKSP